MENEELYPLGSKIRKLREEMGFTVSEVASRSEMTASMLSQVERDVVKPSISSLRKIAGVLKVPAFYFLIENTELSGMVVREQNRTTIKPPGYKAIYQLLSPDLGKRIEMMYTELQSGEATCDSPMSHEGEECLVVIAGTMKVVLTDQEVIVNKGDSIYFDRGLPHQLINIGDECASAICAITPPSY